MLYSGSGLLVIVLIYLIQITGLMMDMQVSGLLKYSAGIISMVLLCQRLSQVRGSDGEEHLIIMLCLNQASDI